MPISRELMIDGYRFTVDDRKLVIENAIQDADGKALVAAVFSPAQANQLAVLLNKLVPDEYGVRSDFRIPITKAMGLSADIYINDDQFSVDPKCLSLSGMFAAVSGGETIAKPGASIQVELRFGEIKLPLAGIVTRCSSTGIGLAFSDLTDEGQASESLTRLVMAVQRQWIAKNAV